jgi:hypothetical protein
LPALGLSIAAKEPTVIGVRSRNGTTARRGGKLAFAVDDSTLGQVVGRDLDGHPVAGDDSDEILAHLSSDMRQDSMAVFQLDHELSVRERFDNTPLGSDRFLFGHAVLLKLTGAGNAMVY